MITHAARPSKAGIASQEEGTEADLPNDRPNQAVGLKAYLDGVAARVKTLPSTWVRCELLTLKPGDRFVRMEFVEHDGTGRKVAQVNGGCWPGVYRRVTEAFTTLGLRLEAGSKVLVKVVSRLDANYGYSVEIEDIDPNYSLGDLKARAEAIRRRLKEGGIWERNRRLRRPADFLRVAVISPPDAAGLGDFRSTVDRLTSAGLVEFTFVEAPFQTPDAAARIVAEMRNIYRSHQASPFCALAIIRGGGAAADLAYLVDDKLAEAVCKMPMPVMTGIGHERDRNLIDEVACLPLDTPSKVAEHIRSAVVGAAQAAHGAITDIHSQMRLAVAHFERGLTAAGTEIEREARGALASAERTVRGALDSLKPDARGTLGTASNLVVQAEAAALRAARARRDAAREGLKAARVDVARLAGEHLLAHERQVTRAFAGVAAEPLRLLDGTARDVADQVAEVFRHVTATVEAVDREVGRVLTLAEALDPGAVLAAGYAVLRGADGTPLPNAALVAAAPVIRAEMRDGVIMLQPSGPTPSKAETASHNGVVRGRVEE
ncbi:exodeoxyribonuclease VII large subunit [Belnapia sp. F-4-1]|uniref:exodeoxyribonuclease VII large subunit n=1 Tax=Belnapia sp. F-4-1 TaxID=1545443 RepID=UPI000689610B|nr:exodeoxyribonuclease VII large subunit [Belnapia sp. F-4-1]